MHHLRNPSSQGAMVAASMKARRGRSSLLGMPRHSLKVSMLCILPTLLNRKTLYHYGGTGELRSERNSDNHNDMIAKDPARAYPITRFVNSRRRTQ